MLACSIVSISRYYVDALVRFTWCGAKAANDLDAFIAGRSVDCLPISLDRYGRTIATCLVRGADLGNGSCAMSRRGLAAIFKPLWLIADAHQVQMFLFLRRGERLDDRQVDGSAEP